SVTELPTGAGDESGPGLPQGAFQLPNDARTMRYVGAAPPPGTGKHRYIFAVLALEAEKIEIDRGATPAWLMYMVFNGTLGRAFPRGTCGSGWARWWWPESSTTSPRAPCIRCRRSTRRASPAARPTTWRPVRLGFPALARWCRR